jgi:hypothetical protein
MFVLQVPRGCATRGAGVIILPVVIKAKSNEKLLRKELMRHIIITVTQVAAALLSEQISHSFSYLGIKLVSALNLEKMSACEHVPSQGSGRQNDCIKPEMALRQI